MGAQHPARRLLAGNVCTAARPHTLAAGPHLCYEAGVECQRHCAGLWVQGALRKDRSVRGLLLLMCGAPPTAGQCQLIAQRPQGKQIRQQGWRSRGLALLM